MPIIHNTNPEEVQQFEQMLNEPGDWVAVYDPETDGNLTDWVNSIRAQYETERPSRTLTLNLPSETIDKIYNLSHAQQAVVSTVIIRLSSQSCDYV